MSNQVQYAEKHTLGSITISKADLLKVLKENREAHNEVYKAATQAYTDAIRAYLETVAERVKALAKDIKKRLENVSEAALENLRSPFPSAQPQKPVSHEDSYDAAIRKVELSVHDEFTLDESDFNQYILNNWSWSVSFLNNATSYGTGIHMASISGSVQNFRKKG